MHLESLPGPGPRSAAQLHQVDIHTTDALINAGTLPVYRRLKAACPNTSLNFLYALVGAMENRHWRELQHNHALSGGNNWKGFMAWRKGSRNQPVNLPA